MKGALAAVLLVAGLVASCARDQQSGAVHIIHAKGDIDPIMERYLDRALADAENSNARAAVIELDTPGGLDVSMRAIVQRIERSNVPVIIYVAPSGSRAASAGTFITMAANIAAMAPNTSIGAASAINSDGSDIEGTLGKKVENDAVAFIRGIAELRGRNADWAEQAVREAVAVNQTQAVDLHVVDFVANDLDDLLRQSDGRTVTLRPGLTAEVSGLESAPRIDVEMTVWERFLGVLANPTIASLLITIGFIALIIEVGHPGVIVPGVVGAIAILLGFLGFGVLPVDTVGLVLIALGLGMIALELFVPGGILGAGGVVAVALGGIIAFRDTPTELRPPIWLVVTVALTLTFVFAGISLALSKIRKMESVTGVGALIGRLAVARTELAPRGYVFIGGERWQAQLPDAERASVGDRLRIVGAEGLRLQVRKEE
jgi:membrane-bound serine protease (ClpP class)